jgi:signal transduction histidine kinase
VTSSNRILIVEDENAILEVYRDILSKNKTPQPTIKSSRSQPTQPAENTIDDQFELTLVPTGEEAVEAVRKSLQEEKPFALGFFDVLLGKGIDGIETVKQIHQLDSHMYAVLVTAYQDRHVDSIRNLFGKEFQDKWDYLNKPFSEGEILQKARNMVSMWNIRKRDGEHRRKLGELKEKLMESEKSLTVAAVARSIGHEFGNILLQIMGRADLSRDSDEKTMRAGLETILVATEHASKVLERFKNMAKPNHSYKKTKIAISEPIKEVLLLIDHELKRKNIAVHLALDNLPEVLVSHSTMVQVFMNLIINSMHAMKDGGEIKIAGRLEKDNLEITVKDSGLGIGQENIEKIFEPFFTTKGDSGTGLGLSICKEIIEITHGGQISASNHPSGGAEFKISIPLEE